VIITKRFDTILLGQIGLGLPAFRNAQIIKPEIGRNMRLIMIFEEGFGLCGIRSFGEALAPPFIIFRYGL
jgi:hypothetical protein